MFVKHVGKHGDRKVAIVYKSLPDMDHMALVVYTETLPVAFHDSIMKVIESPAGQDAENLADALHRNLLPSGQPILETLHAEGMLKRVETSQVIVTPNASSHIRLDELNKMIADMAVGDEAREKMAELDKNAGLVDPKATKQVPAAPQDPNALNDGSLAQQRLDQANKMAAEAEALQAESKRLMEEAYELNPALKPKRKRATKKTVAKKASTKTKA